MTAVVVPRFLNFNYHFAYQLLVVDGGKGGSGIHGDAKTMLNVPEDAGLGDRAPHYRGWWDRRMVHRESSPRPCCAPSFLAAVDHLPNAHF